MSNEFSYDAVVSHLGSQSDAVGRLAQDSGAFAAAVAAFESKDPDAFRWVLNHQEMLPYCELICHWVRVKMCVLRCFEVCGLPQEKVPAVNLQQFARAIVQLASNEKLLRRVVDAVSCGDGDDYRAAINELKLNDYCHLLCHWVCAIIFRRVCERICTPIREPLADAASEIRAASRVFSKLLESEKALQEISKAAVALDCGLLGSSIQAAGFGPWCETICCWICVWWCAYACREVCGVPDPTRIEIDEIEEARNFALASRKIASQPRALGDLVSAVAKRDAKAYSDIVSRYGLGPYCYQLCAWVCSGICYEFCICVCPPQGTRPWFTHVGDFDISPNLDISTTTGLTIAPENGHGGPKFAFYSCLKLIGFCPQLDPGPMAYRFLYQAAGAATPTPIAPAGPFGPGGPAGPGAVCQVFVGTRTTLWHGDPNALQSVWIRGTGLTSPTPPPSTPAPAPPDHFIVPDANGWVTVDPNALGGVFDGNLMGFYSPAAFPGGAPTPGVPAGTPVPPGNQNNGVSAAIIFQATRVSTISAVNGGAAPDYTNQLDTIRINNWVEVNELNFVEFATDCCTPIDAALGVQFTVDHEEMGSGAWSLSIGSCSKSAPGNITPTGSIPAANTTLVSGIDAVQISITVASTAGFPPAPFVLVISTGETMVVTKVLGTTLTVIRGPGATAKAALAGAAVSYPGLTLTARGGAGTIVVDTSTWCNCSYTATLTTRPGLTDGENDRGNFPNPLTFCICGHDC